MKLRANQIVIVVLVLLAGILACIFLAAWSPWKSWSSNSSEEDFLQTVREKAAEDLSTAKSEVGGEAPGGADPSKVPAINVPSSFDAGTVPNDRISTKTLMIGNTGTFDLVIMQITTECPCTVGTTETKVVPAGAEIPMTITVDPKRIPGFESEKILTIFTNDPKKGQSPIQVTAKVEPEFSVEPENVVLGKVPKGQSVQARIIFRQLEDAPFKEQPFEIKNIKVSADKGALKASFSARPESEWAVPGHREYVADITFDSSVAPMGPFEAVLSVDTTCARLFNLRVFVEGEVVEAGGASKAENPT